MEDSVANKAETDRNGSESEAQGAQDDLDALLNEWNTEEQKTEQKPEQKPDESGLAAQVAETHAFIQELKQEKAKQSLSDGVDTAVGMLDKELEGAVPKEDLKDILWGKAAQDIRFQNAFFNRDADPETWNKLVTSLGRQIGDRRKTKVDSEVTEDREAVAAAVRSASTKAPETDDRNDISWAEADSMSDAELEVWVRSVAK